MYSKIKNGFVMSFRFAYLLLMVRFAYLLLMVIFLYLFYNFFASLHIGGAGARFISWK